MQNANSDYDLASVMRPTNSHSVMILSFTAGCGKSTILSVLTDSIQSNIRGKADGKNDRWLSVFGVYFRKTTQGITVSNLFITFAVLLPGANGFVPQDDRLHGFFTVKSYMKHYSRLAGLKHTPELDKEIDELISDLGLTEQAGTIVGDLFLKGLSGGQKRRLSIGLEALTQPAVSIILDWSSCTLPCLLSSYLTLTFHLQTKNLFLDEPTSGLDAESALQVMTFLKKYARAGTGRRVILTIHQPSTMIWQLIDNIVLLSKGKLMYQGSRSAMEGYFASIGCPTELGWNSADHYITLVNDDFRDSIKTVDEWVECFQKYEAAQMSEPENTRRGKSRTPSMLKASGLSQIETRRSSSISVVYELTYRYFLNLWFNPGILGTRLAMYAMLGKFERGFLFDQV